MKILSRKSIIILVLALSSMAAVYIFIQHSASISPPTPAPVPPTAQTPQDSRGQIPSNNFLESVSRASPPSDWITDTNEDLGISVAVPPEIIITKGTSSLGGGRVSESVTYLSYEPGLDKRVCTLARERESLAAVTKAYENTNSNDNGKITSNPLILWQVITSKDEFAYEGKPAVKYTSYNRSSSAADRRYAVKYYVEAGPDAVYRLSCSIKDNMTEVTVDAIFRQLVIQP